jgi:hypothetical protein
VVTDTPFYVLLTVVFYNGLVFGGGWYGEKLLHRYHRRIALRVLQESRLPWRWREWIVQAIYWLYPLH